MAFLKYSLSLFPFQNLVNFLHRQQLDWEGCSPALKILNFGPIVIHHLHAFQRYQSQNALEQALNIDYEFTNAYGRIKTIKMAVKPFTISQNILISNKFFKYLSKNASKCIMVPTKILRSTTVFNINNNNNKKNSS